MKFNPLIPLAHLRAPITSFFVTIRTSYRHRVNFYHAQRSADEYFPCADNEAPNDVIYPSTRKQFGDEDGSHTVVNSQ